MKKAGYIISIYAAIIFFGGVAGGFLAHSTPSLIAGVSFGALIAFNAFKVFRNNPKGLTLALIQAIILGSFFIYRFKTTGKFFPAGIMVTISFLVAILLLMAHPREVPTSEKK